MPSMAFALKVQARLPLVPLTRVSLTTPQTSLHAADRPLAISSTRCCCSASTQASQPTPGAALPGTLASPRTGLTPAGYPELVAQLHHVITTSSMTSARATGRTLSPEIVVELVFWCSRFGCGVCDDGLRVPFLSKGTGEAIGVENCRAFGFVVRVASSAGYAGVVGRTRRD